MGTLVPLVVEYTFTVATQYASVEDQTLLIYPSSGFQPVFCAATQHWAMALGRNVLVLFIAFPLFIGVMQVPSVPFPNMPGKQEPHLS